MFTLRYFSRKLDKDHLPGSASENPVGGLPVITGSSIFGTDFFVKETDLDTAAELIGPVFGEEVEIIDENVDDHAGCRKIR